MMTGQDILREFDRQIFKAYSDYYDHIKKNDLLKRSLISSLQDKYLSLDSQVEYDYLRGIIRLNKLFSLNNNQLRILPLQIQQLNIFGTDFVFVFNEPHNVKVGDWVMFSDIQGLVTIPGLNNNYFEVTSYNTDETRFSVSAGYISGVWTSGTGKFVKHSTDILGSIPKMADDYNHLLGLKARFLQKLDYKVTDVTNTSPIKLTLETFNNNIVNQDRIKISGVSGNTNANGEFYAKKINRKTFSIYQDKNFSTATSGNGDYQGIATLERVWYDFATILFPQNKISELPSLANPVIERGDGFLKILPDDYICDEIITDYVSSAIVFIDVNDGVFDLTTIYPLEFLYSIITKAVQLFAQEVTDPERFAASQTELQTQKGKED